jgi:hypothetical protein
LTRSRHCESRTTRTWSGATASALARRTRRQPIQVLIIRNIPKARADDSGSDSQVIAAAIGRALNDGNGGRPPMQIRRSVGWNSGVVQSAFSSLVNRGHGSLQHSQRSRSVVKSNAAPDKGEVGSSSLPRPTITVGRGFHPSNYLMKIIRQIPQNNGTFAPPDFNT